ncbi:MAG: RidA family protein, partial [Nanoarchaeota archaeon]
TTKSPKAIGHYSQAIIVGNLIFTSGQISIEPETGLMRDGSIEEQTERVIKNLKAILESAGSSLEKVVKVNVYLSDINDFDRMNKVYSEFFISKPARATIQAGKLPRNAKIEMDVIAVI